MENVLTTFMAWVILSGGLGKSLYVQTELERRYSSPNRMFSNTRNLRFKVAPEPQLAVCKGLIVDQQRRLESGTPVLNVRRCRASYGTLCKIEYDRRSRGIHSTIIILQRISRVLTGTRSRRKDND